MAQFIPYVFRLFFNLITFSFGENSLFIKKASAELPLSQPGAKQAPIDRRKQPDASAVINEQWAAAQKSAAHSLRRFECQDLKIESVNGTIECKM